MNDSSTVDETAVAPAETVTAESANPVEKILRKERMPHIWCPGCGIGTTVNSFARALKDTKTDLRKVSIVSGIGCTGRVAGYLNLDSFHTTHGRAIPFATGLKLANPELDVVVYSGDGDLTGIGGNHLIHAARRNIDIKVICINNFTYAMTGGQVAPTTPHAAIATTTPYGCFENAFNLPYLAESCGAVYVARWTAYHVLQLTKAMKAIMTKKGFCFIEVLSPCPTLYGRRNKIGDGLDQMNIFKEKGVIRKGISSREAILDVDKEITLGTFLNIDKKTYLESMNEHYSEVLGDKYRLYGVQS